MDTEAIEFRIHGAAVPSRRSTWTLYIPALKLSPVDFEEQKRMRLNGVASRAACETPEPGWKQSEWARDILPKRDK